MFRSPNPGCIEEAIALLADNSNQILKYAEAASVQKEISCISCHRSDLLVLMVVTLYLPMLLLAFELKVVVHIPNS